MDIWVFGGSFVIKKKFFFVSIFFSIVLLFQVELFSQNILDISQNADCDFKGEIDKSLNNQANQIVSEVSKEQGSFDQQPVDFSFFNKPQKMLAKLPEQCRKNVSDALEACNQLRMNSQDPLLFLFELISRLKFKLTEFVEKKELDNSKITLFLEILSKVEDFLKDQNNLFAIQLGIVDKNIEDRLKEILEGLNNFLSIVNNFENNDDVKDDLEILQKSIAGIKNKKLNVLIENNIKYLNHLSQEVLEKIKIAQDILGEFENTLNESDKENEENVKEAVDFWSGILKELNKGMSEEMMFLKGGFDREPGVQSKIFKILNGVGKSAKFIVPAYAFYRKLIELYWLDPCNKDKLTLKKWSNLPLLLGDKVIRALMIPFYFLKKAIEINNSNINPMAKQKLFQNALSSSLWTYLDPNFYVMGQIWPARALYRMAPAYLYHYIFHRLRKPEDDHEDLGKCEQFKQAAWFSFKDGYRSFSNFVDIKMQQKLGPGRLESLKKNSLGIIKPGLLKFIFDTSMPVLAEKGTEKYTRDFFSLTKNNVFKKEDDLSYFLDWNYVGNTDFENIKSSEFIQGRIVGYLAISLGAHFGKVFTRANRRGIRSLMSKAGNGLYKVIEKLGFLSTESLNLIEDLKLDIKDVMKEFFLDAQDPSLMMGRKGFFSLLLQFGYIDEKSILNIEEKIDRGQLNEKLVDEIIDKIITTITDNILIYMGGLIGMGTSWYTANYIMKKYVYPKPKKNIERQLVLAK